MRRKAKTVCMYTLTLVKHLLPMCYRIPAPDRTQVMGPHHAVYATAVMANHVMGTRLRSWDMPRIGAGFWWAAIRPGSASSAAGGRRSGRTSTAFQDKAGTSIEFDLAVSELVQSVPLRSGPSRERPLRRFNSDWKYVVLAMPQPQNCARGSPSEAQRVGVTALSRLSKRLRIQSRACFAHSLPCCVRFPEFAPFPVGTESERLFDRLRTTGDSMLSLVLIPVCSDHLRRSNVGMADGFRRRQIDRRAVWPVSATPRVSGHAWSAIGCDGAATIGVDSGWGRNDPLSALPSPLAAFIVDCPHI